MKFSGGVCASLGTERYPGVFAGNYKRCWKETYTCSPNTIAGMHRFDPRPDIGRTAWIAYTSRPPDFDTGFPLVACGTALFLSFPDVQVVPSSPYFVEHPAAVQTIDYAEERTT